MKFVLRFFILPIAFFQTLFKITNNEARDIQNKLKFRQAKIDSGSSFTKDTIIGKHSHILANAIINHSHIGNYTYCNRNVLIQNAIIGNYCSISNDVIIGLGKHPLNLFSTSTIFYKAKNTLGINIVGKDLDFEEYKLIKIGSDVWIGARAIIMDGVNIGHGAVVAAGAVVTKDVAPYSIVGGVPAKLIKYRFDENSRQELLNVKWWNDRAEKVYADRKMSNSKLN